MKNYFLAIDIGNTQISFGFFQNDEVICRFDLDTHLAEEELKKAIRNAINETNCPKEGVSDGLIGSVVPSVTSVIAKEIKSIFGFDIAILNNEINKEVKMDIDNPLEVGADILADIVAATNLYKSPIVVTDLGTITKYIVIDENKSFIGTSFYPGVKGSLKAMGQNTALLPNLDTVREFDHPYGKNTVDSMVSGIYFGTVSSVLGINNILDKQFNMPVSHVLTGGYSNLIHKEFESYIFDKDLTLKGLYLLKKGIR